MVTSKFECNNVILITKTLIADTISQFRPIDMANFKFKIISKILADRLAHVLPDIISRKQRGFIKGKQIKECICLTSEAIINLFRNKCLRGKYVERFMQIFLWCGDLNNRKLATISCKGVHGRIF